MARRWLEDADDGQPVLISEIIPRFVEGDDVLGDDGGECCAYFGVEGVEFGYEYGEIRFDAGTRIRETRE